MHPRVLYIMGTGRSGSTILGVLLGAARDAVFAGELTHAPSDVLQHGRPCACGAATSWECELWGGVRRRLAWGEGETRGYAKLFHRVDWHTGMLRRMVRPVPDTWRRANSELLSALHAESGARVVVDSSKFPARGLALSQTFPQRVSVLRLTREPAGLLRAFSKTHEHEQRGKTPASAALWYGYNAATLAIADRRLCDVFDVSFEELRSDPVSVLLRIEQWCGLDLSPARTALEQRLPLSVGHVVTGNRLRAQGDVVFRVGDAHADPPVGAARLAHAAMVLAGWGASLP